MNINIIGASGEDIARHLFSLAAAIRRSRREYAIEVAQSITDAGFECLHLDDVSAAEQAEADERDRAERRHEERRDAL